MLKQQQPPPPPPGIIINVFSFFFIIIAVWQVYPRDTPLSLFASLLPEDVERDVGGGDGDDILALRQLVSNAIQKARRWIHSQQQQQEVSPQITSFSPFFRHQSHRERIVARLCLRLAPRPNCISIDPSIHPSPPPLAFCNCKMLLLLSYRSFSTVLKVITLHFPIWSIWSANTSRQSCPPPVPTCNSTSSLLNHKVVANQLQAVLSLLPLLQMAGRILGISTQSFILFVHQFCATSATNLKTEKNWSRVFNLFQ